MSPDLPEKVLGIDLEDSEERQPEDDEELERFVAVTIGEHRLAVSVDAVKNTTGVPADVTPVPRSPEAIEGVTDHRGEVIAVIDPRVHFPTDQKPASTQQLLVLDRPDDDYPVALRVDEVHNIEAVPEDDVLQEADVSDADIRRLDVPDNVFEHPLIHAIAVREERVDIGVEDVLQTEDTDDLSLDSSSSGFGESGQESDQEDAFGGDVFGDDIPDSNESEGSTPNQQGEIKVETTPLVDIESLLLATGYTDR
ncbi:chemotaxis protein CheW [Natrialbaceae archaeon A-gly3]